MSGGGIIFPVLKVVPILGTKVGTTQTPVTLTNAYSGNVSGVLTPGGSSELVFDVYYTTGSGEAGTTLDIQVLVGTDGTNFANLTNESASSGTSTLYIRTFALTGLINSPSYKLKRLV